jgi:hypothetical protein
VVCHGFKEGLEHKKYNEISLFESFKDEIVFQGSALASCLIIERLLDDTTISWFPL